MGHDKDEASDASATVEASDASDASEAKEKKHKSKSKHKSSSKDKKKSKSKDRDKKDKKSKSKDKKKSKSSSKDKKSKSKDKTKKSSAKRGPREAQWKTWKAPFQPGSNLHTASQAMMSRKGLKVKDYDKMVKKLGANGVWLLKMLKRGESLGWTWDFDDSHDRYRITNVKLHKNLPKAA